MLAIALSCASLWALTIQASAQVVLFDASTLGLSNGANVANWGGQASSGTPTFNTGAAPLGGSAVTFDAGDYFGNNINVPSTAAQDFIIAAVIRPSSINAYHNIIDDDVSNRPMLWIDGSNNYELNFGGGVGAKQIGTGPGGWDVMIADSRTNSLYVNNGRANATGGGAVAYNAAEGFDFFHRDGTSNFRGQVAELRIYNDAADFNSNFATLHAELKSKWIAPAAAPVVQLDATQLALSNGANVTTWGGLAASGTPTLMLNQTPNNKAAVVFNGTDHMGTLSIPSSLNGDFIIAAVLRPTNTGAYHNIVDDDVQNRPMLWVDNTFRYEANFGGTGAEAVGTGTNGWDIVIFDSLTNNLYVNSPTPNATGGGAVPYTAAEFIDLLNRDGGQTFQGSLAELRIYNDFGDLGTDFAGLYQELYNKFFVVAVPEPSSTFSWLAIGAVALAIACGVRRRASCAR
jgi:hypothetical protein